MDEKVTLNDGKATVVLDGSNLRDALGGSGESLPKGHYVAKVEFFPSGAFRMISRDPPTSKNIFLRNLLYSSKGVAN